MEVYGDSREQAEANLRRSDAARAAYYKSISGDTWGDRAHYDLMLDSSIGVERAAEVVARYAAAAERALAARRASSQPEKSHKL